jgi:hypothetical protein
MMIRWLKNGQLVYGLSWPNSVRLITLPPEATPQVLATKMRGGAEAFANYLGAELNIGQQTAGDIETMFRQSSKFEFGNFIFDAEARATFVVEEETATLWSEIETLGSELLAAL